MDKIERTLTKIQIPLIWLCWKIAIIGRGYYKQEYLELKKTLDEEEASNG